MHQTILTLILSLVFAASAYADKAVSSAQSQHSATVATAPSDSKLATSCFDHEDKAVLIAACKKKMKDLSCDTLAKSSPPDQQKMFASCDDPEDVCAKNGMARLYACGSGVGGVVIDNVLGIIRLPQTVMRAASTLSNAPEVFHDCNYNDSAKFFALGAFKPDDMTNTQIHNMSCVQIQEMVNTKVRVILDRLEQRRQDEMTKTGKENISYDEMKLSQAEFQALNYDRDNSGILRRAACFKPEMAAKVTCGEFTKVGMVASAGLGAVKLIKVFTASRELAATAEASSTAKASGKPTTADTKFDFSSRMEAINEGIDDALYASRKSAESSPMARHYSESHLTPHNDTFEGTVITEKVETTQLIGGGWEGQVLKVIRPNGEEAVIKYFRSASDRDAFVKNMAALKEDAVPVLDYNPKRIPSAMSAYKRGITMANLEKRWSSMQLTESEMQAIRRQYKALEIKYQGSPYARIEPDNVIYSFEEQRLYIIDPS